MIHPIAPLTDIYINSTIPGPLGTFGHLERDWRWFVTGGFVRKDHFLFVNDDKNHQQTDKLKISVWRLLFLTLISSCQFEVTVFIPPPWPPFLLLRLFFLVSFYCLRSSANPALPPLCSLPLLRCVHDVWEKVFTGRRLLLSALPAGLWLTSSSDEVWRDVLQYWRTLWKQNLELWVIQSKDTTTTSSYSAQPKPLWRRNSESRTDGSVSLWTHPRKLWQERGLNCFSIFTHLPNVVVMFPSCLAEWLIEWVGAWLISQLIWRFIDDLINPEYIFACSSLKVLHYK